MRYALVHDIVQFLGAAIIARSPISRYCLSDVNPIKHIILSNLYVSNFYLRLPLTVEIDIAVQECFPGSFRLMCAHSHPVHTA